MSEINIDATLIREGGGALSRTEERLVKMTNGCICCTLRDDLLEEVDKLARAGRFDYLLIESSGISEPMPVAATFSFARDDGATLGDLARLDTMVTVVDAAEPLSCAVRGYDLLRSQLGASVLIYGSGTMGLMMLELAKRTGAASVDVVDLNSERLATARELGCSRAAAGATEFDQPRGWDVVIDATGNEHAIQDALGRVGRGGTYLQFGVAAYAARATIEPYKIYNQEITITGSMAVLHSYERAAALFATGVLDPGVFISDRYPLTDYATALQRFQAGQGRKILVTP